MLSLNDQIKISKVSLSGEDYFVLSQMYLPLIGMDSYSVYIALSNINNKDNMTTVMRLLDLFSLTNVGVLENAIIKLEGIGLVKRFVSESKGITLLQLNRPMDSESFLSNPLLSTNLENLIGPVEYKNIYNSIFKVNHAGYKEITKSYDEVFEKGTKKESAFNLDLKRNIQDNIRVKNDKFDYVYFKLMFNEESFDSKLLDSDDFEQLILRISYQYQLDEVQMHEACIKTLTLNKKIDSEALAKNAAYIYQNKKKSIAKEENEAVFTVKEAVDLKDLAVDEEDNKKLIQTLENTPVENMLAKYSGGKASVAELKNFAQLANENSLSDGLINLLIIYVLSSKNGEIPGYSYLEKIVKTWLRAGVKTVEEAIKYLNRPIEPKETTKRGKKAKTDPEWVKEYIENIKELKEEELSEEEIAAGKDLFE